MKLKFFLATMVATTSLIQPVSAQTAKVAQGSLKGTLEDGAEVFKNIPFAAPPVGPLRWKPPQPAKAWTGVRDATTFGAACIQPPVRMGGAIGALMPESDPYATSEDCLNLNVRRPAGTKAGAKLPVMVWIYGGGFSFGRGSQPTYTGTALVKRGVILVTPNYRLGALGFLAHPELSGEDAHNSSGNYGALDTVAALQWVKRNIGAMGGDPDNVTVFGESAGGIMVGVLAGSPLAKGMFKRVISQSGVYFTPPQKPGEPGFAEPTLAEAEQTGSAFLKQAGVATLAEARALPAERILAAGAPGPGRRPFFFRPVIDGWLLPKDTYSLLKAGAYNATPVIVGSNNDEGSLALPMGATLAQYNGSVQAWGASADALRAAYPATTDAEATRSARDLQRDSVAGWSARAWAVGQSTARGAKVYVYNFNQRPPYPKGPMYDTIGATHAGEMPYVFGTLDSPQIAWAADDRAISDATVGYWTNFAKTGDPNGGQLPAWKPWSAESEAAQQIGQSVVKSGAVANLERLKLFDAIYAARRNRSPAGQ